MITIELRKNIISALLLAIGLVLNILVPSFYFMKFDSMLTFIFLAILVNRKTSSVYIVGIVGGVLEALTTSFPGGQIPNIIDLVITVTVLLIVVKTIGKIINDYVMAVIFGLIGTLVSGASFLYAALLLVGLPASFNILFMTVVVPTMIGNTIVTPLLYYVFIRALNLTNNKLYEIH